MNAFVCHNYYVDDLTIPLIVLLILFNNVKMYNCMYNINGIFQFLNVMILKWLKLLTVIGNLILYDVLPQKSIKFN